MALESVPDYKSMKVGDRAKMPFVGAWEGENQRLFYEVQDWCATTEGRPQFEVETVRGKEIEFWLKRIR